MDKDLKNIIIESGNNLHLEVAEFLQKQGWSVDLSVYYCDDITDKPREIDIIAKLDIPIYEDESNPYFSIYLFIECKYLKSDFAFRMYPNDIINSKSSIITTGYDIDSNKIFNEFNHHYLKTEKMAKLHESNGRIQADIFEAIIRPVKSMLFFKKRNVNAIYYPLAIYKGIPKFYIIDEKFHTIKNSDKKDKYLSNLVNTQEVIYGLKYSYYPDRDPQKASITNNFCVDFIHQKKLGDFLKIIMEEAKPIKNELHQSFKDRK